ncbi:hypothetical protein BST39_14535 [Mycobacterium paraseoulense]|uniref:Secreted protein n=1 Tax=Mycobacterium paraseoulense TaxID=590652 RepID=A0A1X0I9R6_9MYCO|nr:hypothetical protein BST39_14535 [Mycobacterium paraseoulense]
MQLLYVFQLNSALAIAMCPKALAARAIAPASRAAREILRTPVGRAMTMVELPMFMNILLRCSQARLAAFTS